MWKQLKRRKIWPKRPYNLLNGIDKHKSFVNNGLNIDKQLQHFSINYIDDVIIHR